MKFEIFTEATLSWYVLRCINTIAPNCTYYAYYENKFTGMAHDCEPKYSALKDYTVRYCFMDLNNCDYESINHALKDHLTNLEKLKKSVLI